MVDNETRPDEQRHKRDLANESEDRYHYRARKSQKLSSQQHGRDHSSSKTAIGADSLHEAVLTFDAMNLKPGLLRGIYSYGYERPSAIQQRAIRPIIQGRDVIAQSQSGTGRSVALAFAKKSQLLLSDISRKNSVYNFYNDSHLLFYYSFTLQVKQQFFQYLLSRY
jgi:hypothetical protein